jgi:hypothetical protein
MGLDMGGWRRISIDVGLNLVSKGGEIQGIDVGVMIYERKRRRRS